MGYFSDDLDVDVPLNLLGQHFPLGFGIPLANSPGPTGFPQVAAGADPAWALKCWQAWQRCQSRNPNDKTWVNNCSNSLQQCLQTPGITTLFPGGIYVE